MPDHSLGDEVMFEERDRGGSHAPRNSLNISVITLDDTSDAIDTQVINTENESVVEVMQELATSDDDESYYDAATSNEDYNNPNVDIGYDVFVGIPPVSASQRIVLERNRQVNEDEDEDAIVNDTIDLTHSPHRPSQIASPRQEQSGSSPSLKCPVCMEDFLVIRRRGIMIINNNQKSLLMICALGSRLV